MIPTTAWGGFPSGAMVGWKSGRFEEARNASTSPGVKLARPHGKRFLVMWATAAVNVSLAAVALLRRCS